MFADYSAEIKLAIFQPFRNANNLVIICAIKVLTDATLGWQN